MGLRTTHYAHILEEWPEIDWFEIISENFMDTGGRPHRILEQVRERYPVVMHGVSMSIGTTDPQNSDYLAKLKALAGWLNPPWISDHLCWTGIAHRNTHDLLPVPYTEEALSHIVDRIKRVQDFLGRPILMENPSTYLEFQSSQMPEWEFIARMAEEADCGLLLDANNVYVTCYNHRLDPKTYLDAIPADRVIQVHLAGHTHKGTHIVDTHNGAVIDEVWTLYRYLISRAGEVSTMIEWDDDIPEFDVVKAEVEKARAFAKEGKAPNDLPALAKEREIIISDDRYSTMLDTLQTAILEGRATDTDSWIRPKAEFPTEDQLGVYLKGYRLRLKKILEGDLPALRAFLGEEASGRLIDAYIEATPSTSWTIARYIDRLPEFVEDTDIVDHELRGQTHELARLETEMARLFHAPESPALTTEQIEGISPEQLMASTLVPRSALTLMTFSYPVNRFYSAVINEDAAPDTLTETEPCWLALFRHEDSLWRLELEAPEYQLLTMLFEGCTVGEAIEALAEEIGGDALSTKLEGWFSRWINAGMLSERVAGSEG